MSRAFQLKKAWWEQNCRGGLPSGYREVEYLQNSGSNGIDTGLVHATPMTYELTLRWNTAITSFNGAAMGTGNAGWTNNPLLKMSFGKNHFTAWYGSVLQNYWYPLGTRVTIAYDWHTYKLIGVDGAAYQVFDDTYINGPFDLSLNDALTPTVGLLAWHPKNGGWSGSNSGMQCKGARVWQGDVLVRDYVPCVRIIDSKPGMYDLCGSTCPLTDTPFYVNANAYFATDFTWGELS